MRPKSAQQQIVEGDPSKRGVHKLETALASEPRCESGLPPCPARLKGEARDLYEFFREQLTVSHLDKRPDGPALTLACVQYATILKADRRLAREGEIRRVPILAGAGRARKIVGYSQEKNRWWPIKIEAEKMFRAFASEFGLTGPSSRVGLAAEHSIADANCELWSLLTTPRPPRKYEPEISGAPPDAKLS